MSYQSVSSPLLPDFSSDPFVAMARSNKRYGYAMALWEVGDTCPTLFRKVSDYKRRHRIATSPLWTAMMEASWAPLPIRPVLSWLASRDHQGDGWNFCHFWSNFEIADMDWYRSKEYRDFFETLDADGGFYFERVSESCSVSPDQLVRRSSPRFVLGARRYIHIMMRKLSEKYKERRVALIFKQ